MALAGMIRDMEGNNRVDANPPDAQDIEQASPAGFPDLGSRLRTIRETHGLSQRALARAAGVTNATVSNIEQNHVSPSVASLRKLTKAMGLSLAEFFAWDAGRPKRFFFPADALEEIGSGGVSLRLVAAGDPERALQVLVERYDPGADTGPEMLQHPGEEAGYVLRGRITITAGGRTSTLGPGDAYQFPSTLPHRFVNEGDEPCELVSAATPPTF
jgi:transcriptional regulator with XRE-family HTH domain